MDALLKTRITAFYLLRPMRNTLYLVLGLIVLGCLAGCSLPEIKQPRFKGETTTLFNDIQALHPFEEVQIQSSFTSTNGHTEQYLTILLVSGKELPGQPERLAGLGKIIAGKVKNSLENTAAFASYRVVFQSTSDYVIASSSQSYQVSYKSTEI
jgi:hypothetical protein